MSGKGVGGRKSGVSQNIYMYPGSSWAEMGLASSERRRAVVWGVVEGGIRARKDAVREGGSRGIGGRWGSWFGRFSAICGGFEAETLAREGIGAVESLLECVAGRDARFPLLSEMLKQQRPKLLFCCF